MTQTTAGGRPDARLALPARTSNGRADSHSTEPRLTKSAEGISLAVDLVRRVYTVEEAAAVLGIGRTFMFRLLATGQVESFKIGKRRKVTSEAIEAYVRRLIREQAASSSTNARR
jgi:excisionase family DNA binding protein